jgi:hypothetical protein
MGLGIGDWELGEIATLHPIPQFLVPFPYPQ